MPNYNKQTWADGAAGLTPLSAERLQHLEDGLEAVDLAKVDAVSVGVAGGVAELDADGLVPLTRMPDQSDIYARVAAARPGNRWVALGDSLTAGVSVQTWVTMASWLSLGRLQLVKNAGVGGNTSAQMLSRFDTDVTPYAPNLVTILAGTNDTGQSVPLSTFQSNIQAIVAKCRAIGAVPVLATMPPNSSGTPANRQQQILVFNGWLRRYAAAQGLALLDFYNLFVDPTNAAYLSTYKNDGTHPNAAGFAAMGSLANTAMSPLTPQFGALLCNDNIDANNKIKNPLFITQTANPGVRADTWNAYGAGGTYSTDGTDTSIKGYWQTCAMTSGSNVGLASSAVTGFTPTVGNTYAISGLFKASSGLTSLSINLQGNSGAVLQPVQSLAASISKGAFYGEYVCASGVTSLSLTALASGTGNFSIAQCGIYDLTAMGIA